MGNQTKPLCRNLRPAPLDRLEVVCYAVAGRWNGARRFEELEECLAGKALSSFRRLVCERYLNLGEQDQRKLRGTVHADAYGTT